MDGEGPPGERAVQGGATAAAQLVWILAKRLPEAEGGAHADEVAR